MFADGGNVSSASIASRNSWKMLEIACGSQVKKVLTTHRYPKMHQLEEAFQKKRKGLNLPSNISLYPSPFFEGRGLRVEFRFETMEEYRSILSLLSNLADKEEFQEMVKNL